MTPEQIESAADSLATILDDITAGRITSTPGQAAYIAGAHQALLAVLGRGKLPNLDLPL
jgi:hypothetical protein